MYMNSQAEGRLKRKRMPIERMKLTSQIAEQLVTLVKGGASGPSAADALHIPLEIYTDWLTTDPAFAGRIEHAEAEACVLAQVRIHQRSPGLWLKDHPKAVAKAPKPKGKPWDKQKVNGLTSRQRLFVRECIKDSNGTQAAIRAGYSHRCAAERASLLLDKPNISAAIEARRATMLARTDISVERVLRELTCVGYFNPGKLFDSDGKILPIDQMPEEAVRAISGFEVETTSGATVVKLRFAPKTRALEAMMKHLGMFDETRRLELTGKGGAAIAMNVDPPLTDEEKRAEAIEIAQILVEVGAVKLPEGAVWNTNGKAKGVVK